MSSEISIIYIIGFLFSFFAIFLYLKSNNITVFGDHYITFGELVMCLILSLASWFSLFAIILFVISDSDIWNKKI